MTHSTIIELYSKLIRDLVNYAAKRIDSESFIEKVKVRLGFDKLEGWNVLTSSLDLLDNTELAKNNYLRFGLLGPTRYEETGEMYLRLYGILNAIYLQKSAIEELAELFKIRNKDKHSRLIDDLPIIQFRHIAGSHTVNFVDPVSKRRRSFVIAQYSLNNGKIQVLDDDNKVREFDLPELTKEFNKTAESLLDIISDKAIRSICKTDKKGKSTFGDQLDRIRKTSQGVHFVDLPDGRTLVFDVKK